MDERVILHVDMNAFFAAVEQRYNPAFRGRPIVVCGNPKSRTVVAACSYEAKAFGIKNGMSVWEARRLCPHVIPVGGNPDKYVDIARGIFAIMGEATAEVEVFSIDEAFLDVTDTYALFGPAPEDTARRIKRRIKQVYGLTCSVGIGPNKLIAKVASDLQKPDGLVRVRRADVPALMERLPIEELCGIGPKLKVYLNDYGIITCGDLGRAPEKLLVSRFGIVGTYLKRMGRGIDHSPVMPFGAEAVVKSMGHSYTLPRDTPDDEEIRGTLLRLAEQVGRRLRAGSYQGRTIGLTIRFTDFATMLHHRTVRYPTDSGLRVHRIAMELFHEYFDPLPHRVRLVGVGVSNLTQGERQLSWLDEERRMDRLDRCLDLVCDRFGEYTLVRASALSPLVSKSHGFLVKHKDQRRGLILR